jgi:putative ABC transport system substrate-binding protein
MKRREFLWLAGGGAIWPVLARGQARMPVIGWLSALSKSTIPAIDAQFHRGLSEVGFNIGGNVRIDYRWAEGHYERLPALALELVRQPVDVIVAQAPPAAVAARTATTTIPIVFSVGVDPVGAGLVASYARPDGNATGVTLITGPLGQKRIEILRELVPKASSVGMLVNPFGPDTAPEIRDVQAAAKANDLELRLLNASTPTEVETAFKQISEKRPDALLIGSDPFYQIMRQNIVAQVARLGLVAIYPFREFVEAGGLISYGTNIPNAYRQAGIYVGRILKGAKPSELPVMQPTRFELVINLKTATTSGYNIPPNLHARSDEVIE